MRAVCAQIGSIAKTIFGRRSGKEIAYGGGKLRELPDKSRSLRCDRHHALTCEEDVAHGTGQAFQNECGDRQEGRAVEGAGEHAGEVCISHRGGGHGIDRSAEGLVFHGVENEAREVGNMNPRHPLTPAAEASAHAESESAAQHRGGTAVCAEDHAGAKGDHPAQVRGFHRGFVPCAGDFGDESTARRRGLGEFCVAGVSVEGAAAGADEHTGRAGQLPQPRHECEGIVHAAAADGVAFFCCPEAEKAFTGQVDHGVQLGEVRLRHRLPRAHIGKTGQGAGGAGISNEFVPGLPRRGCKVPGDESGGSSNAYFHVCPLIGPGQRAIRNSVQCTDQPGGRIRCIVISFASREAGGSFVAPVPDPTSSMTYLLEIAKFIGILFCVLLIFNFIILVHEWGHFLAARWRGLKIEKFQIWMGKTIWKRTWNGVQYGLGTIPIGGFVQLPQMAPMGAIEGKTSGEQLPPIKPLDKIIVAFAGPLFSLLLAFVFALGVWIWGRPQPDQPVIGYLQPGKPAEVSGQLKAGDRILEIDGNKVNTFNGISHSVMWAIVSGESEDVVFKIQRPGEPEPRAVTVRAPYKDSDDYKKWEASSWWEKLWNRPPLRRVGIASAAQGRVKEVMENSPAAEAGVKEGDIILSVNGEKTWTPMVVNTLAYFYPEQPLKLDLKRGDQRVEATIKPRPFEVDPRTDEDKGKAHTGLFFESLDPKNPPLDHPLPTTMVADCFRNTWATLKALIAPRSNIGISQMSGPVGIMNLYYNIFQSDQWWRLLFFFSVVLNVGLAIFNMLPLPVLDGGHITMAVIESIRRRPPNLKLMEYIQAGCVVCLLSLVLFICFKDVGQIAEDSGGGGEPKFLKREAATAQ